MTKWYYKNSENYKRQSANISSPNFPYMSWLDYKRKFRIVKYYPTYNMYINYRYWCFANSYTPFGGRTKNPEKSYKRLLEMLADRL